MNNPFVDLAFSHTVDGRDRASQLIGSSSRCSQGFTHPRWLFGISFTTVHQAFFTYSKDRGFPRIQVYIPSTFGPCVQDIHIYRYTVYIYIYLSIYGKGFYFSFQKKQWFGFQFSDPKKHTTCFYS